MQGSIMVVWLPAAGEISVQASETLEMFAWSDKRIFLGNVILVYLTENSKFKFIPWLGHTFML